MFKSVMPKTYFVCYMAICIYIVNITVEIIFMERTCVKICLKPCSISDTAVPPWEEQLDFEGFNNGTGTPDGHYVIPNYVHFIQFGFPEFSFRRMICILAAFKNQRPDKLFIHTDQGSFHGKYWNILKNTTGFEKALVIRKITIPTHILGQPLRKKFKYYHGADVARLQIMMTYGGIYLDTDSYIVKSLDDFRRFEMALGWQPGKEIGNQIVLAHKSARFLRLWYNSYMNNYNPISWLYNAVTYPTIHILEHQPHLVHRVEKLFGVYPSDWEFRHSKFYKWREFYTIHLQRYFWGTIDLNAVLKRGKPLNKTDFKYSVAFMEMCKDVHPSP